MAHSTSLALKSNSRSLNRKRESFIMKSTALNNYRRSLARFITLAALALLLIVGQPESALAQQQPWQQSSSNPDDIHNTNTGNVGIGTTTPSALLTVERDQATGTEIRINNPHTAGFAGLYLNGGFAQAAGGFLQWNNANGGNNLFVATGGNHPLYLGTNNAVRMTTCRLPVTSALGQGIPRIRSTSTGRLMPRPSTSTGSLSAAAAAVSGRRVAPTSTSTPATLVLVPLARRSDLQ